MRWTPIGIILSKYNMDPVQRRNSYLATVPMYEELDKAVNARIEKENEFKGQIIEQIKLIISRLQECDPTNAESTLNLTVDQLRKIITKLTNTENISVGEVMNITKLLTDSNLRRAPAAPAVAPAAPAAPAPAATPPAPANAPPAAPALGTSGVPVKIQSNAQFTPGRSPPAAAPAPGVTNAKSYVDAAKNGAAKNGAVTPIKGGKRRTKRRRR